MVRAIDIVNGVATDGLMMSTADAASITLPAMPGDASSHQGDHVAMYEIGRMPADNLYKPEPSDTIPAAVDAAASHWNGHLSRAGLDVRICKNIPSDADVECPGNKDGQVYLVETQAHPSDCDGIACVTPAGHGHLFTAKMVYEEPAWRAADSVIARHFWTNVGADHRKWIHRTM